MVFDISAYSAKSGDVKSGELTIQKKFRVPARGKNWKTALKKKLSIGPSDGRMPKKSTA